MKIYNNYNFYSFSDMPKQKVNKAVIRDLNFKAKPINIDSIRGQENCWKLYDKNIFKQFLKADEEIIKPMSWILDSLRAYLLEPDVSMFYDFAKEGSKMSEFFDLVKAKYDIDLTIPPKVYRFVSKREIDALYNDGKVETYRCGMRRFDVTVNPELNWNDYRITFKPKQKFSVLEKDSLMRENPGCNHEYFYHFLGSYSIDDVEKIEQIRR